MAGLPILALERVRVPLHPTEPRSLSLSDCLDVAAHTITGVQQLGLFYFAVSVVVAEALRAVLRLDAAQHHHCPPCEAAAAAAAAAAEKKQG